MYYMDDILNELKEKIETNNYTNEKSINFLEEDDLLDDDYTRSEVAKIQREFMDAASEYLKENHPGKFIIYCDWCVHICTVELKNELLSNLRGYRQC